jgi:alkanesulfonate monooxygenase SsuD/methylene tetrahydromethanopterin reductase-like flavin-dependent oxidoreductase (luciferase family)
MKFSLFAHMERTQENQSYQALYAEFIDLCLMADEGGMHAIWTGEHHGMDFTISPNPLLTLIDLARRTKNVRLGTGTIAAPFWHPIKLAGELAMADLLCDGRLEVGIARGAYMYEYERLLPGLDAIEAGLRLRELVPAVKNLWQGDYSHEGEFYQFPSTSAAPKPIQASGPPLWIAARDPNSHEFAISNNCNVQVTPLWLGMEEVESLAQRFSEAVDKNLSADTIRPPKLMILQHAYVGSTEIEVKTAAEQLSRYYCQFGAWFKNERPVTQGRIKPMSENEVEENKMYAPSVMRNNLAIGTVSEIIERLKIYEALGYDEFSYWIDSGLSIEQKKASLSLFINEVMPAFAE